MNTAIKHTWDNSHSGYTVICILVWIKKPCCYRAMSLSLTPMQPKTFSEDLNLSIILCNGQKVLITWLFVWLFVERPLLRLKNMQLHKAKWENKNKKWRLSYSYLTYLLLLLARISSIRMKTCHRCCWTSSTSNTFTRGTKSAAWSKSSGWTTDVGHGAIFTSWFRLYRGSDVMQQHNETLNIFITAVWSSGTASHLYCRCQSWKRTFTNA